MNEDEDCIIARKLCCGRVIFATGTSYGIDKETKAEIADMALDKMYQIEHMPASLVRKAPWGCKCGK